MATKKYPVLLWTDHAGGTTATLLGDSGFSAAAYAASESAALHQLKELLDWRGEHEPWNLDPDFLEPELIEVKVEVRPQYLQQHRILPCPDTVLLRVPCVTGKQESGLSVCIVPHLSLIFSFQEQASLKSLIAHYVREGLQGSSPRQLAGRLPPRQCRLDEIVVKHATKPPRARPAAERPEFRVLFAVADPLMHDQRRKRSSSAAYGRDNLSGLLVQKLEEEKANVLLVGESGVGKSTLLLDAVRKIFRQKAKLETDSDEASAEAGLAGYRYWRGSAGRMIAGMRYLGEWEERCEAFIQQLGKIDGVFCVENLLELVQVGGEGPGDSVAAFLLPYLQRRELRVVAEATPAEVEACRRLLPGLLDLFQVIQVAPFADATALDVLAQVAQAHAAASKLEIEPGAVTLAHRLFKRFLPYAVFPGPAAHFVRVLCEPRPKHDSRQVITTNEVVERFIKQTGLPEIFLRDDWPLDEAAVRAHFEQQIIGQPEATTVAARLITTIKAGLTDPGRPFGVLLFCGPTGVGKTALVRALADYCFGASRQKDRLVRLDMSEYSGWNSAQRLLEGPGQMPAAWIDRVRRQPFCVVLFDEIEKAAAEVFDVLLGLLDEGRLTDRFGRVTQFRSAIIVLTSNLGSNAPQSAGFQVAAPAYESEVARFFRPEFFNRLDGVVTFNSLTSADVEAITRKELAELAGREGFASAGIRLEWSEKLIRFLARQGYDSRLGARPLQRALERLVVMPLARWKVAHPGRRDLVLHLELSEDKVIVLE
jgi:ATP-dependent Clp protease ATP-binding subunit ClpC